MPIGYGLAFYDRRINWMYHTEPDPGTGNRVSYWPRGKVLGGSSSINAMVYVRGHSGDFDDWEAMGNPGWGWNDVLPYFKKSETSDQGETEWRGGQGPAPCIDHGTRPAPGLRELHPRRRAMRISALSDFNGASNEGVGCYQNTARDGFRMSTARAYLQAGAPKRPNLTVITHAQATGSCLKATAPSAWNTGATACRNGPCRTRGDPLGRRGELAAVA
jgi:choline dehydrogenase